MELARKVARRFNDLYGETIKVLKELLSTISPLPGINGNSKMGKSLGNAIYLSDDCYTVITKVKSALTDKNRIAVSDKGNPNICTVAFYHKSFNSEEYPNICEMCRKAKIGGVGCKKLLYTKLNSMLAPFREKRAYYEQHKDKVREIIISGTSRANRMGLNCKIRRKKYSSYRGEIDEAAPNLIQRDFHAEKPNQKWTKDVTEFRLLKPCSI